MSFIIVTMITCTSRSDNKLSDNAVLSYNTQYESTGEIISRFLDQNPIRSLSVINKFFSNALITQEEFKNYENLGINKIKKKMRQYYLGENYIKALVYLDALNLYKNNSSSNVSDEYNNSHDTNSDGDTEILDRKVVYAQLIQKAHEDKNYPLAQSNALKLFKTYPEYFIESEIITLLSMEFVNYKEPKLFQLLCDSNQNFDEISCESLQDTKTMEDMLESTFIVDIDKGISTNGIVHEIGSAFFITVDGYALTNYHVIKSEVDPEYKGKSEMVIKISKDNYRPRKARVVGYDPLVDLALIKVDDITIDNEFTIMPDTEIYEGDKITVIGSPIGLVNTVTSGILSSRRRDGLLEVGSVLQMDASVNPGNSGGPLLNEDHEVIGVVVAKLQGLENINFAIPSAIVSEVLPQLFFGNKVTHSWLGVGGYLTEQGFEILYVAPNSSAEHSELLLGDVIISINDVPITDVQQFQTSMLGVPLDSLMKVNIIREIETKTVEKTVLLATSERIESLLPISVSKSNFDKVFPVLSGTQIKVTDYRKSSPQYRLTKVYNDSLAEFIGFTAGDLVRIRKIQQIDSQTIAVEVRVIQQSRGFLDDVFVMFLVPSTKDFL